MATQGKTRLGAMLDWLRSNDIAILGIAVVGAIAAWYLVASLFPYGLLVFPHEMIAEVLELFQRNLAIPHLTATLSRTLVGFVGATGLGIAVGVIMGLNNFGLEFLTPYVFLALTLPGVAWAAVLTIAMGFGFWTPVAVVSVTAWPFVSLIVWKGVEDIDRDLILMSESFNIPRGRLLLRTIFPNVAPSLFSAIRYGIVISWSIETNAEIFATNNGIGYKIVEAYDAYQYNRAFAWAFLFLFVILILEFGILRPIERRVYSYRRNVDFEVVGRNQ